MADVWSSPFSENDYAEFREDVFDRQGSGGVVEESTLKFAFMIASTNIGTVTNPLLLDVLKLSSDAATAAGPTDNTAVGVSMVDSPTTFPLEPSLNSKGLVPIGTQLLIGGIGVIVNTGPIWVPAYDAAPSDPEGTYFPLAAAEDAYNGIQAAFDAGIIVVEDARTQKSRLTGHEVCSWGSSRLAAYGPAVEVVDDVAERVLASGSVAAKDRGWAKVNPIYFDGGSMGSGKSASQLKVGLIIPRSTNWPIRPTTRMRVEVMFRALVGYQGSAGNIDCDPAAGTVEAPVSRRIEGKRRW